MLTETPDLETLVTASIDRSNISVETAHLKTRPSARLFVAMAAAVSALAGGLAAAWYYRRTLSRLQQAELEGHDSKFGISGAPDDEGL